MNRRSFMQSLSAAALAGSGAMAFAANKPKSQPNIVYILADDMGIGDLGCYGQKLIKTPNIDRMATEGLRFTDHYSGNTVCAPSRCVLMTGLHAGHAYIRANQEIKPHGQKPIPADTVTVAKLLKQAGYATGCCGKWGLGYVDSTGDPNKQGFDHFFGYLCQRAAHEYYPEFLWRNGEKVMLNGKAYSHDLMTKEGLKFIEDNADKPFFLYMAYTIPHLKFQVPELGEYADKPWKKEHKAQAAMISRLDRDVGRILALLKAKGLDERTLVIFTSDNGAHAKGGTREFFKSTGIYRMFKRALYEGGVRTPMIARWPGVTPVNQTTDHVSAFWDVLPTFCELAGAPTPSGIDGITMVPTLTGDFARQKKHDYLYWEYVKSRAIRRGKWKAVQNGQKPIELYDLEADASEKKNLAATYPEEVSKLETLMDRAHVDLKQE